MTGVASDDMLFTRNPCFNLVLENGSGGGGGGRSSNNGGQQVHLPHQGPRLLGPGGLLGLQHQQQQQQHASPYPPQFCPQCRLPAFSITTRMVREACGHLKCRQCLLQEDNGCQQCHIGLQQQKFSFSLLPAVSPEEPPRQRIKTEYQQPDMFPQNNGFPQVNGGHSQRGNNYLLVPPDLESLSEMPGTPNHNVDMDGTCSMSSLDAAPPVSLQEFALFKARLGAVREWVRASEFEVCDDDELEWLRCQYAGRLHDALGNEEHNAHVINRGKIVGLQFIAEAAAAASSRSDQDHPGRPDISPLSAADEAKSVASICDDPLPPPPPPPVGFFRQELATREEEEEEDLPVGAKKKAKRKRNSIDHQHFTHIIKNTTLDPPEYLCNICNRQFKNRLNIRYHIACADKSAGHACKDCGRIFKSSSHLTYHTRTAHGGEKPYKCRFCEKAFAQSVKLKRHELTHTGERPFKCETCQHTFTTKYNLKEHENIHRSDKPYKCATCAVGFADRNNLRRHELAHENGGSGNKHAAAVLKVTAPPPPVARVIAEQWREEEIFSCDFCPRHCRSLVELKSHQLATHSEEQGLQCELCGWILRTRSALLDHRTWKHGGVDEEDEKVKFEEQRLQPIHLEPRLTREIPRGSGFWPPIDPVESLLHHRHRVDAFSRQFHQSTEHQLQPSPAAFASVSRPRSTATTSAPAAATASSAAAYENFLERASSPLHFATSLIDQEQVVDRQEMDSEGIDVHPLPTTVDLDSSLDTNNSNSVLLGSPPPKTYLNSQASSASASLACVTAFNQVKILLKQIQGKDIYKVIDNLSSLERRTLIRILRTDAEAKKSKSSSSAARLATYSHLAQDRMDAFSDISTGSKKEFLKRYKRQILEEGGESSSASTVSFVIPSAANSITALERRQLLEDFATDEGGEKLEFPTPYLTNNQFDNIMKGIHAIIDKQKKSAYGYPGEDRGQEEDEGVAETVIKTTGRGLRKVAVFDDEDERSGGEEDA